jgi:hypothetical protein
LAFARRRYSTRSTAAALVPFDPRLCRVDRLLDERRRVAARFRRPDREAPHLVGHHREALPGVAGTRCLDRGVERQQVRPERDRVIAARASAASAAWAVVRSLTAVMWWDSWSMAAAWSAAPLASFWLPSPICRWPYHMRALRLRARREGWRAERHDEANRRENGSGTNMCLPSQRTKQGSPRRPQVSLSRCRHFRDTGPRVKQGGARIDRLAMNPGPGR